MVPGWRQSLYRVRAPDAGSNTDSLEADAILGNSTYASETET